METDKPTMSESIGKLAAALSAAQGMMQSAKADSENPFFKSKYADLASVWESCRKPLAENKLAVAQTLGGAPDAVEIITTLLHESGEWIRGTIILKPVKADPQGIGSTITYGRRYGLAAIIGIVQEDDDGNAASKQQQPAKTPQKPTETPKKPIKAPNPTTHSTEGDNARNQPETTSNCIQIPGAILDRMGKTTVDDAMDILIDIASTTNQLADLKKIVLKHCPEFFDMERTDIPEATIAQIIKDASGVEMKEE